MRTVRCALVAALTAITATATAPPAHAAPPANCRPAGEAIAAVPWAQQMFGPDRVWPLATGRGVTVAVVDSGVDATQPQLRGRVSDGVDLIDGAQNGTVDCTGHGTQAAGVIVAQPAHGLGLRGLAPDVTIAPARVSDAADGSGPNAGAPGLARAIDWAVGKGARVIDVSVVLYTDDPQVRAAVARAVEHDVVVVAAVGNLGDANGGNPTPYPAAYPDVIGVGAVDPSGVRWPRSQHGSYVDLVAPGVDVVTTQRGGGLVQVSDTSVAAAFVSATAALVRARLGGLSAADVRHRLLATATPAAGGPDTDEYGHGIVDPSGAVTDGLPAKQARRLPGLAQAQPDDAELARAHAWSVSTGAALRLTCITLLVVVCVLALARVLPLGRRRRWYPGLAPPPRDRVEEDGPSPPVHLFEQ